MPTLDLEEHDGLIVVNFHRVQFVPSAALGELVLLNKKAKAAGIDLYFRNVSPDVLEVLKICRLDKLAKIINDDDPGTAGSLARLIRPPETDGGQASPEPPADETE